MKPRWERIQQSCVHQENHGTRVENDLHCFENSRIERRCTTIENCPLFERGKWSAEPPTEPGWYWATFGTTTMVYLHVKLTEYSVVEMEEKLSVESITRWYDQRVEMPPLPESEGE